MPAAKLTPMMRQYQDIRRELPPNTLLLFRLGDFYEMFFDDAREASALLNVALTKRGDTPMCGVPYHSARAYVAKLVEAGKRVAICDQVGEVTPGKLVRREISRILSAGTLDDFGLEENRHNYLAAVVSGKSSAGLAWLDLSTGEFRLSEIASPALLADQLARLQPSELLVPDNAEPSAGLPIPTTPHDCFAFDLTQASDLLRDHFRVQSLDGFGCADLPLGVSAAGALLHYVTRSLRRDAGHLPAPRPWHPDEYVLLDAVTQANLELVESRSPEGTSLRGAIDRTLTPMGARLLRGWLLHPLRDLAAITVRQDLVAAFHEDPAQLGAVRDILRDIRDMERAVARLSLASGNARDLVALRTSLELLPPLRAALAEGRDSPLLSLAAGVLTFDPLVELLRSALADDPPPTTRDGGMIREGYDPDLDELRRAGTEGRQWIAALQDREIARTGIKSLKIRYNSVFGYYIEVTKTNLASVPDDYTRKQTTANSERFITPELKEMEGRILGGEERARALETEIFGRLRTAVLAELEPLQRTAQAVANIDALAGLAETARTFRYIRPKLTAGGAIRITDGRHPVLDQTMPAGRFVPNDTDLDTGQHRLVILTGPNMAGKSTYIRQVALLVLLAQTGSFIPATAAEIGVVDRIFTRVGATDDLARGQSTFMVEMNETANILNNATDRSLVILDEIGRGTSTFDGLSIAWSVAEFLHDTTGCRTLFATHYHELTDLARTRPGAANCNVAVREWNDDVIFLRKIVPGPADQSYGIQVARLAGLPEPILRRAREILGNLEQAELNAEGKPVFAEKRKRPHKLRAFSSQLDLFEDAAT
ncbi:MAG: DNA mismatch repair protein MutS [Chthoniobacterales bacterium]|nr:DNA mismatch repair protein MutS [Chthoniobacterales bacterium]